jgi:hypothetical protein
MRQYKTRWSGAIGEFVVEDTDWELGINGAQPVVLLSDYAVLEWAIGVKDKQILEFSDEIDKRGAEINKWHSLALRQADELAAKDQRFAHMEQEHIKAYKELAEKFDKQIAALGWQLEAQRNQIEEAPQDDQRR